MADRIVKVEGLSALAKAFNDLDQDIQKKVASAATFAGAKPIRDRAKALAPVADAPYKVEDVIVQPKNIARNIVAKKLKRSETRATSEHLVVVRGKRKYGYASRVASLQEFGTVNQPAQRFIGPAFDQAGDAGLKEVVRVLKARIDKANSK